MISVIMGVYNGEKTVVKAVSSVLNGTFTDLEFIAVDDGSTDKTVKQLEKLAENDQRLKVIRQGKNMGLAAALNVALSYAQGDFIARQDADDISHPDRLIIQNNYLLNEKKVSFLGCGARLIDENERVWGERVYPSSVDKKLLFKYNPFIHSSVLFKAEALKKINGYNEDKSCFRCEDYDLYFRLYDNGFSGGNLKEILIDYYENTKSSFRHTKQTRLNEFLVRKNGLKLLNGNLFDYFYCIKPLILYAIPDTIYNKLHNSKWRNYR